MKRNHFLLITKIPFLSFLLIALLFLLNQAVFAQSSDCVITKVGDPGTSPTPICPGESGQRPGAPGLPEGSCQEAPVMDFAIPQEYMDEIEAKWGIHFYGTFTTEQMRWIWEEFWAIDCTGFLQDIAGTWVQGTGAEGGGSRQRTCPGDPDIPHVEFAKYGESGTKGLIVHELTHVWQKCSDRGEMSLIAIPEARQKDARAGFAPPDGYLTTYPRSIASGNPCLNVSGVLADNEDHADTIALYLNPTIGELTCGNGKPNPFENGAFPNHRALAEKDVAKK